MLIVPLRDEEDEVKSGGANAYRAYKWHLNVGRVRRAATRLFIRRTRINIKPVPLVVTALPSHVTQRRRVVRAFHHHPLAAS